MAFVTTSLPNNGVRAHFAVSYDETLPKASGLERVVLGQFPARYCKNQDFNDATEVLAKNNSRLHERALRTLGHRCIVARSIDVQP
jgi:hypothetical protein